MDDKKILELSLKVLTEELDKLVGACIDPEGKPKVPTMKELMQARAMLPSWCKNAFPTKAKKS